MRASIDDLRDVRHRWWLFLGLGVLLVVLGLLALSAMVAVTWLTVVYVGCLLLIGGASQVVSAFSSRIGSGFFFHLLAGALDAVIGLLVLARPGVAVEVLTLLLAVSFLVGGLFRIAAAAALQYPRWGLSALSGAIGMVLGVCILQDWRANALWIIGLFVGIDLIARGFSWVVTSLALRSLHGQFPASPSPAGLETKP